MVLPSSQPCFQKFHLEIQRFRCCGILSNWCIPERPRPSRCDRRLLASIFRDTAKTRPPQLRHQGLHRRRGDVAHAGRSGESRCVGVALSGRSAHGVAVYPRAPVARAYLRAARHRRSARFDRRRHRGDSVVGSPRCARVGERFAYHLINGSRAPVFSEHLESWKRAHPLL